MDGKPREGGPAIDVDHLGDHIRGAVLGGRVGMVEHIREAGLCGLGAEGYAGLRLQPEDSMGGHGVPDYVIVIVDFLLG